MQQACRRPSLAIAIIEKSKLQTMQITRFRMRQHRLLLINKSEASKIRSMPQYSRH